MRAQPQPRYARLLAECSPWSLLAANPMMDDVRRNLVRLWLPAQNRQAPIAIGVTTLVIYLFFVGMVLRYASDIPPIVLMYVLLGLVHVVQPLLLHGVIAGEREKRSLDMLLVAPVTVPQIVIAKLLRSVGIFISAFVALTVPAIIVALVQLGRPGPSFGFGDQPPSPFLILVLSSVVIAGSAFLSAAITVLISSMCKSLSSALMTNIAVHFLLLVVYPVFTGIIYSIFVSVLWSGLEQASLWYSIISANPFVTLTYLASGKASDWLIMVLLVVGHLGFWVVLGLLCTFFAMIRLDRERS